MARQGHGAAVVLARHCALCRWVFIERLVATNVGRGDRLGHRVAIDDGIIVATGVATYKAPLIEASRPTLGARPSKIRLANQDKEEV